MEHSENLDTVIDAVAEPIVIYDKAGRVQKANSAAQNIYGFDPSIIDRAATIDRLTVRHRNGAKYKVEELPSTRALQGEPVFAERMIIRSLHGIDRIIEESALPLRSEEQVIGAVIVLHDITEQEDALADMKESRKQVLDVLESISDGFFALDALWRFTYINSRAQQLFGLRKEDVLFKGIWDKLPNAQVLRMYKELNNAAENKQATSFEEYIPAIQRWLEFHVYPYMNGLSVYFSDITERKKTEESLKKFSLFAQSARDIMLFIRKYDGRIIEANEAAIKAYGYDRDELLSKTIFDLRSDSKQTVNKQMAIAAAGGLLFETSHKTKEGVTFPVEVSSRQANINDEDILLSVVRDISKRKKAEEALKAREEQYRRLVQHSPDGLYVQIDNRIVYMNNTGMELLGANSIDEVLGRCFYDFLDKEYHPIVQERVKNLRMGKSVSLLEEKMVRLDGTRFPVEVAASPVVYDNQSAVQVIFRDISERKRTEADYQLSKQRLSSMLQAIPDFAFLLDAEGTILKHHAERPDDLYVLPESFLGLRINDVLEPEAGTRIFDAVKVSLRDNIVVDLTYSLVIDNRKREFEAKILPAFDDKAIAIVRTLDAGIQ